MADDIQHWETSFLGTILADQKQHITVSDILPENMSSRQHQIIWSAMLSLARRDGLGAQSLINELTDQGVINDIGSEDAKGDAYIFYLMSCGDFTTLDEFADRIRDRAANQKLLEIATYAISKARQGEDPNQTVDWLTKEITKIRREKDEPVVIGDLNDPYDKAQENIRSGAKIPFWEPPLRELKDVIKKLNKTDFALIVGRPGTGKSSFLRWLGIESALRGETVLMMPFENSKEECHSWGISQLAQVNHNVVEDTRLANAHDLELIEMAKAKLDEIPYHIKQMSFASMSDVIRVARRFALDHPLDLILIDGVYLIAGKGENYDRISMNVQLLRSLAQDIGAPVIGTTQFSKKAAGFKNPELDQIYYAGDKEARLVISINKKVMSPQDQLKFPLNRDAKGKLILNRKGDVNSIVVSLDVLKNTGGNMGETQMIAWHKPWNIYETFSGTLTNPINEPDEDDEMPGTIQAAIKNNGSARVATELGNRPPAPAPKPPPKEKKR